ncbi:MAG: creatininase family protein [Chitinispirillaceae bacterium]|nr:creatininase family protein [Chitinispirillaceae bacterium]
MSFRQIERHIKLCPSLILPVGGLEPVGDTLPLGIINSCCGIIADTLSDRLKVLVAPLIAYGNSTPFKSFGGSAGIHYTTLANVVTECCKCWFFQGIKRIMVLTLAMDGRRGIDSAVKRFGGDRGEDVAIRYCSLQDDDRFRSFCMSRCSGTEYGRSEWGVSALAVFCRPDLVVENRQGALQDSEAFKQWHRRGRDPDKLRKMAPEASFSILIEGIDAGTGKELFDHVVDFLTEEFSSFLIVQDNASR